MKVLQDVCSTAMIVLQNLWAGLWLSAVDSGDCGSNPAGLQAQRDRTRDHDRSRAHIYRPIRTVGAFDGDALFRSDRRADIGRTRPGVWHMGL